MVTAKATGVAIKSRRLLCIGSSNLDQGLAFVALPGGRSHNELQTELVHDFDDRGEGRVAGAVERSLQYLPTNSHLGCEILQLWARIIRPIAWLITRGSPVSKAPFRKAAI